MYIVQQRFSGLRIMKTSTIVQENMEDILAEAEAINEARSEAEEAAEVAEDETGEVTE